MAPLAVGAHLASLAGVAVLDAGAVEVAPELVAFYEREGGEAWFGRPVSDPISQGDICAQYFEFALLEWHEADDGTIQVALGRLGEAFALAGEVPAEALAPAAPWMEMEHALRADAPAGDAVEPLTLAPLTPLPLVRSSLGQISVMASVKYPQTGLGGYQTVYVTTRDSQGKRLPNVGIELIVRYPNQDTRGFAAVTGDTGRAAMTFAIGRSVAGLPVIIDVVAARDGLRATTQVDFTPWW